MDMNNDLMISTKILLSKTQADALRSLTVSSGKEQNALIGEAIELLLHKKAMFGEEWKQALHDLKGIWHNDDHAEQRMNEIRKEFDR